MFHITKDKHSRSKRTSSKYRYEYRHIFDRKPCTTLLVRNQVTSLQKLVIINVFINPSC